jgi:RND family efflux transporter MFP subunit
MQAAHNSTIFNDLLTLVWGATILFVSPVNGAQAAKQNEVVAYVSVAAAKEEVLQSRTIGFGKVQSRPADVISVDAPIDSIVSKVYVRPGESAKQGSSLVDLTTAATTQDAYHKAQTAVDFANAKLKRMEFLWSKRDITQQALDQAQVASRDAQSTLQALKQIGAGDQQTTIKSPIAGTITAVSVSQGDRVTRNAKILSLSPGSALAVLLGVEPAEAGKVQRGMPVDLSPATALDVKSIGRVSAVNAVLDPQTRLVDVLVDLESGSTDPQPIGTYMRGEIILKRERAVSVPRSAILYDKKGAFIFLVKVGRAHRLDIVPGAEDGDRVGVTGAIKPGDSVVVQGNYELKDGMKVDEVAHAVR